MEFDKALEFYNNLIIDTTKEVERLTAVISGWISTTDAHQGFQLGLCHERDHHLKKIEILKQKKIALLKERNR